MKKNKKQRIDWFSEDPIVVWKTVREGTELKVFPNNYLNKDTAKLLIRELLLKELKLSRDEMLSINYRFLSNYKLGGTRKFFDNNITDLLIYCFPEFKFHPWEVTKSQPHMWEDENIRSGFIRWVAEKENIDLTNIKDISRFSAIMIQNYGGSKALKYGNGLFELIKPVISPEIKEWQVFKVNKWDKDKAIKAVKWLIEEQLKWSYQDVYEKLTAKVFYKNNLGGLLSKFCHNSPYEAFNLAYPNVFDSLKNEKPF